MPGMVTIWSQVTQLQEMFNIHLSQFDYPFYLDILFIVLRERENAE
jgi:hypothetical protein